MAEHEDRNIRQYVEGQLHDDQDGVTLVQRVGQERVAGTMYSMYDRAHDQGPLVVITDPTDLYDQDAFPEMDYVLSFHIGLRMRVMERSRVEVASDRREHAEGAWRRYAAAADAMNTANDAEDMRS